MIQYIHSATVLVSDQDTAVDFYTNKLGFEKTADLAVEETMRWIVVTPPGQNTGLALLTPSDMGLPAEMVGNSRGISLIADDVQQTYNDLVEKGVQFTQAPEQMPWGAMATWLQDPDGNTYFLTSNESKVESSE